MNAPDILSFLSEGDNLLGVHLNSSIDKVIEINGTPKEIVGDNKAGFLHYSNGLRYGYFNSLIDELSIIFLSETNIKYKVYINEENRFELLTEKTQIQDFISILNFLKIKWKCHDEGNLNVFSLVTSNKIYALFDLETGFITKVSKSR